MDRRRGGPLSDAGQALAEIPAVIAVLACVALVVVQVALFSLTHLVVTQVASDAARVAATLRGEDGLLRAFVASRLDVLDASSALMVPGSLRVSRSGTPRSALVEVTVEVRQRPLPIVGWVGAGDGGDRVVRVRAQAPGGESWVVPSAPMGEGVYGAEQKP